MMSLLTNCSAADVGYYLFLFVFSFLTMIVQSILENNLIQDGGMSFHSRTNHTTTKIYEQDALRLLDNLPSIMPIILALLFLDPSKSKFAYRLPIMGLLLTSIITLLPAVGGTNIPAYYVAALTHSLSGGIYLVIIAALSHAATTTESRGLSVAYGRMVCLVLWGQACGILVAGHYEEAAIKPILVTVCVLTTIMMVVSFIWTSKENKGPSLPANPEPNPDTTEDITCKARLMKPFKLYSREQGCYTIVVLLTVATYKACQTSGQVATKIFVTDPSRLNWSAERFTVYLGCVFVSQGLSNLLLMPVLVKKFYLNELTILMTALGSHVLSLALTSFSTESWMIYLTIPLDIVSGLAVTCCLAILTRLVNIQDIGKVFSIMMMSWIVCECFGALLATVIALQIYSLFHGSACIILAVILMGLFGVTLWLSHNLQTYHHQVLLDNVKATDEGGDTSSLEMEAEQWLLDAYENNVCEDDNHSSDDQSPDPQRKSIA